MRFRAVIFDLGGVVLGSPLHAIARYERERGLPVNCVNRVVADTGREGAWSRLERGELSLESFYSEFETDCRRAGFEICARTMMERMAESAQPRPAMLTAVARLRAAGHAVAALTNNWGSDDGTRTLRPHFDVFIESSVEGLRKPDRRIYELACERLGVAPHEAVFLDDIGSNLKAARALGIATIKVEEPDTALAELEALLGLALRA
jgi:putative hydrolase of the HAD superfamily